MAKIFDLFGGIGGFSLGAHNLGHDTAAYCDWDKHASAVYRKHFPKVPQFKDARAIEGGELPNFDLLCAGFPCQPFSLAGKRKGTNDNRGTLFEDIARIARVKRPGHLLLENVKGLLTAQEGWAFLEVIATMEELGYDLEWQVLNSENFGVPQGRERVFIVGHFGGQCECRQKVFPFGGNEKQANCERAQIQTVGREVEVGSIRRTYYRPMKSGVSPTLTANMGTGGHNVPIIRPTLTPNRIEKRQNGRRFKENGESSFTITTQDQNGVLIDNGKSTEVRKFTPVECERLQGFPDGWTSVGNYGGVEKRVADGPRYKMTGNAVTVNVVQAIMERLTL